MTFVADLGSGSMATCSRYLARELGTRVMYTRAYERAAVSEGLSALDPRAFLILARDFRFLRSLRRIGGVVHLSNHHLGRFGRFLTTPYIVTVHDLIRLLDMDRGGAPEPLIRKPAPRDRVLYRLDHEGIRRATALIATSAATRRDLIRLLGVAGERVTVVHNGIDHQRFRPTDQTVAERPYVLFVGVEHPRKNLIALLRAFRSLKRDSRFRDLRLVKVGGPGYRGEPFRRRTLEAISALGLEREVEFAERVEADEMPAYYSGAECLVMPSLYEGFGLPVIEAMACGCPVIVSDRASLPEIAGEAALVTKPDPDPIAEAIRDLLGSDALRESLRARGLEHARKFTWAATAARTRDAYRAVLARESK
ncbi:MAG TPA: glycosyltransferase family 1 protein [Solirubrobacterales bacterium]|nr:glycosyltransferase family 1 protein [Solirubrobacterales bacterium]